MVFFYLRVRGSPHRRAVCLPPRLGRRPRDKLSVLPSTSRPRLGQMRETGPNAVGNRIGATVGSRRCEHSREHHIPSRLLLLCFHAPSKFEKEQRSAVPPTQIDSRRNPRTKKLIVRTTRRTSLTKLHSIGGRSYTAGVPLLSWKH